MHVFRSFLIALILIPLLTISAYAKPEGPAQKSVEQWFSSNFHNATVQLWQTFYDTDSPYMLAIANYSQEGNAIYVAVALFKKGQDGKYVYVKTVKPKDEIYGETQNVTFSRGSATVFAKVPQPGDGRCCPTGKKTWKIISP